jgi:alkylation response protein AidB-like acyl-CoA dehydrogenase
VHDFTPHQHELQARARALAEAEFRPRAATVDETEAYPWASVAALAQAGFMGMAIPKQYGGQGASCRDVIIVVEEMARCCATMGRIAVDANLGAVGAVMRYGSDAQKRLAAGLVLAGDKPAICISEPGAGSAATATS